MPSRSTEGSGNAWRPLRQERNQRRQPGAFHLRGGHARPLFSMGFMVGLASCKLYDFMSTVLVAMVRVFQ